MELIARLTSSEGSDSFKPNDSLIMKVTAKRGDIQLYMGSKQWEESMAFFALSMKETTVSICAQKNRHE
jgi:hypothetical protein